MSSSSDRDIPGLDHSSSDLDNIDYSNILSVTTTPSQLIPIPDFVSVLLMTPTGHFVNIDDPVVRLSRPHETIVSQIMNTFSATPAGEQIISNENNSLMGVFSVVPSPNLVVSKFLPPHYLSHVNFVKFLNKFSAIRPFIADAVSRQAILAQRIRATRGMVSVLSVPSEDRVNVIDVINSSRDRTSSPLTTTDSSDDVSAEFRDKFNIGSGSGIFRRPSNPTLETPPSRPVPKSPSMGVSPSLLARSISPLRISPSVDLVDAQVKKLIRSIPQSQSEFLQRSPMLPRLKAS